jgi:tRNA(Ile2) C34 agmatinyltransferase TiaS
MEHQNTIFCPRCHSDLLLQEAGGTYRCGKCDAKFYRGATAHEKGSQVDRAIYYAPQDPERGPVHLPSQTRLEEAVVYVPLSTDEES